MQNSSNKNDSSELLVPVLRALTKWRRLFVFVAVIGIIVSLIIAFLIPPKFKAIASVLPAEKSDVFSSLGGIPSLVKSISSTKGFLRTDPELEKYSAILKSGRVFGEIIRKYDLAKVYNITNYPLENTAKELLENIEISVESEGYLTVTVFDKDAKRAADMANSFVSLLTQVMDELSAQNASATRMYIEIRYNKCLDDLSNVEDSLKYFQKKYGIISFAEQTEASIKAGAELEARLALKQIELGVQQKYYGKDYPDVLQTEIEIQEIKKKLQEMEGFSAKPIQGQQVFLQFNNIADVGIEYLRKYRAVEIQSRILQFISPLYEQAKVDEQKQTPPIIVLDKAYPAERKSKPKRSLIVLGGLFASLFGVTLFILFSELWQKQKKTNSDVFQIVLALKEGIKRDLFWIGHRKR